MWLVLAFLSAGFAGITAILAKIGLRNVNSNLAPALLFLGFASRRREQGNSNRQVKYGTYNDTCPDFSRRKADRS